MKKSLLVIGLVMSVPLSLYSCGGITMAYWVAALPGQSPEHIRLNFLVWIPATILSLALGLVCLIRLLKK